MLSSGIHQPDTMPHCEVLCQVRQMLLYSSFAISTPRGGGTYGKGTIIPLGCQSV